jgi:hypothetical protein
MAQGRQKSRMSLSPQPRPALFSATKRLIFSKIIAILMFLMPDAINALYVYAFPLVCYDRELRKFFAAPEPSQATCTFV